MKQSYKALKIGQLTAQAQNLQLNYLERLIRLRKTKQISKEIQQNQVEEIIKIIKEIQQEKKVSRHLFRNSISKQFSWSVNFSLSFYNCFDQSGSDSIDFQQLQLGVILISSTSLQQKLRLLYSLQRNSQKVEAEQLINRIISLQTVLDKRSNYFVQQANKVFHQIPKDQQQKVTQQDFLNTVSQNPVFRPILDFIQAIEAQDFISTPDMRIVSFDLSTHSPEVPTGQASPISELSQEIPDFFQSKPQILTIQSQDSFQQIEVFSDHPVQVAIISSDTLRESLKGIQTTHQNDYLSVKHEPVVIKCEEEPLSDQEEFRIIISEPPDSIRSIKEIDIPELTEVRTERTCSRLCSKEMCYLFQQMNGEVLIVFLCLLVIYGATSLLCVIRLIQLRKFSSEWRHSQVFYISVTLQAVLRALCFGLLCLDVGTQDLTVYFLLSLPDSIFIISYILLSWQMVSVYYYSHERKSVTSTFLENLSKKGSNSKSALGVILFICVWILLQMALYVLVFCMAISQRIVALEIGVVDCVIPLLMVVAIVVFEVSFSGVVAKSQVWKHRLNRIKLVTLVWSLTRILRGIMNLIDQFSNSEISSSITTDIEFQQTALFICVLIFSQILCIYLVLDYGFMGIFIFSQQDHENQLKKQKTQLLFQEEFTSERRETMIFDGPYIRSQEVEIKEIFSANKHKLGIMHTAIFKDQTVAYRKIGFARTSKYVIEEIQEQIEIYKHITANRLVPIYGVVMEIPIIGIIEKYIPMSLYKALHIDKIHFTSQQKLVLVFQIAKALSGIHRQNKYHGHLTSHNVLLKNNKEPLISGFGFTKVKKYAGIMFGYTYKSGWSSPQILKEKRLTPVKTMQGNDIYSFGMIVWEIFSQQEPFAGYPPSELNQKVVVEGLRPKIPQQMHPEIQSMVLSC